MPGYLRLNIAYGCSFARVSVRLIDMAAQSALETTKRLTLATLLFVDRSGTCLLVNAKADLESETAKKNADPRALINAIGRIGAAQQRSLALLTVLVTMGLQAAQSISAMTAAAAIEIVNAVDLVVARPESAKSVATTVATLRSEVFSDLPLYRLGGALIVLALLQVDMSKAQTLEEDTSLELSLALSDTQLDSICRYSTYAAAAYGRPFLHLMGDPLPGIGEQWEFARHCGLPANAVVESSWASPHDYRFTSVPVIYVVSRDTATRKIVLTLRGTLDTQDILTDLMCKYSPITWNGYKGYAHEGMLRCARMLLESPVFAAITNELRESPGYSLDIVGHSLGAGVGTLLLLLLTDGVHHRSSEPNAVDSAGDTVIPESTPLHCYCYGPPAVLNADLATLIAPLVTSLVNEDDIIPHLSLGVFRDIKAVAVALAPIRGLPQWAIRTLSGPQSSLPIAQQGKSHASGYSQYLKQILKETMASDKLVPPGKILRFNGVTLELVPNEKFGRPRLNRTNLKHSPVYYQEAAQVLSRDTRKPQMQI